MYQETHQQSIPINGIRRSLRLPQILIEFADAEIIRARKVVRRSNARITGKYPGWKANRTMQWESPHERNAMILLDACPSVVSFNEQPCEITYVMEGKARKHYPDLLVKSRYWQELWEVKTRNDAESPEVSSRTEFLSQYLPAYGYGYRLVLAEDLAIQPRLKNAELLLKLGKTPLNDLDRERTRQLFMEYETLTWDGIKSDSQNPKLRSHVCRLILDGLLTFNMDKELAHGTTINWVFNTQIEGEKSWASLISKKA